MEEELGRLKDAFRRLQKAFFSLNTVLREMYEIQGILNSAEDAYFEVKRITESYGDLDHTLKDLVIENDFLPIVKETKAKYDAVHSVFRKYAQMMEEIDAKMEKYRTYRYYIFREDDDMLAFIDEVFGEVPATLKPLILKQMDEMEKIEKLGVSKKGRFSYDVPPGRLRQALTFVITEVPDAGFTVEADGVKATWKPENGLLRIDAPEGKIFEYDALARKYGATVLNI